jgi:DNA-binding HxlR family transcriptional regulator
MTHAKAAPKLRLISHAAGISCPVERAIQVIGGRWRLLVLRSLLLDGAQRYNQLLRSVRGISAKELTRNLRALEALGLVAHGARGAAAQYALTELGAGLGPAFESLMPFGEQLAAAWSRRGLGRTG